jgi:hypothetical protein
MNQFLAGLTSGLAVARSAQGVQVLPRTAGQYPPFFRDATMAASHNVRVSRVERHLFASPNAIKVGASSDHERSTPLDLCTRRFSAARA